LKIPNIKRADGVPQSVGPEFKPQYLKKNKKEKWHKIRWKRQIGTR
jgi:hypothetical protein